MVEKEDTGERKKLGKDALETHDTLSIVRTRHDRRGVSAGAPAVNVSQKKMTWRERKGKKTGVVESV